MYAIKPPMVKFLGGNKAELFTYSEAKFYVKHADNTQRTHLFTAEMVSAQIAWLIGPMFAYSGPTK